MRYPVSEKIGIMRSSSGLACLPGASGTYRRIPRHLLPPVRVIARAWRNMAIWGAVARVGAAAAVVRLPAAAYPAPPRRLLDLAQENPAPHRLHTSTGAKARQSNLIAQRACPKLIVSDNGTEPTSNAVLAWSGDTGVEWHISHLASQRRTGSSIASMVACATSCST